METKVTVVTAETELRSRKKRFMADARHTPELQTSLYDAATGMRGFVVADRLVAGRAMGGTRIATGFQVGDIATLARRMSMKLALAGIAMGGCKGGVLLEPGTPPDVRARQIEAFGRLAAPLLHGGVYLGTDLGCRYQDRAAIHAAAGYSVQQQVPSLPYGWDELWQHCRDVSGQGAAHACAVAAELLELPGPEGRRLAIQGFGEVGQAVARHGRALGLRTVAVADKYGTVMCEYGLPLDEMFAITDEFGTIDDTRLPAGVTRTTTADAWLDVDAEILVLAAIGDALTPDKLGRVRAKIIVEGANGPVSAEARERLAARGEHLVVPDIVANAGGAIGCGLGLLGEVPADTTPAQGAEWLFAEVARRVRDNTRAVCSQVQAAGGDSQQSTHAIADALADERLGRPAESSR